jgi:Redoxin
VTAAAFSGSLWLLGLQAMLTTPDGIPHQFDPEGRKAVVVVFVSAVCPVSNDYADRITRLWRQFGRRRDVGFLVVYPNKTESLTQIRAHAAGMKFPFPVYRDDNNILADRLGARVTPTAAVCDRNGSVTYLGAIDDAANPARVKQSYLRNAIGATLDGRRPAQPPREPYG